MTELEKKYLVHEQTTSLLQGIHQHIVYIPSENTYLQSLSSIQASPSTSVYSESISSPFSLYNFDDSNI